MKKSTIILILFFIGLSSFNFQENKDKPQGISAEKAEKLGIIHLKIQAKGGHQQECINAEIKNLLDKDTLIRFEPGRRLISKDTSLQDILVIREMLVRLAAKEIRKIDLYGFCCRAAKGSPAKNAAFDIGYMTDSTWIKLCEILACESYPTDVIQHAVWVLSDNHTLNSVHNDNEADFEKMQKLYRHLSKAKGLKYEYPWYTLIYKKDSTRVFSNQALKINLRIAYSLPNNANVDMVIRNADNLKVYTIFSDRPQNPDTYKFHLSVDVSNFRRGKYNLLVLADNQLLLKKEFEI